MYIKKCGHRTKTKKNRINREIISIVINLNNSYNIIQIYHRVEHHMIMELTNIDERK